MPNFRIFSLAVEDGTAAAFRVVAVGELDLSTATEVKAELFRAVSEADRDVEVDLSEVVFIDASGIGALVEAAKRARVSGQRLILRRPSEAVTRVIELCGLDGHFLLVDPTR